MQNHKNFNPFWKYNFHLEHFLKIWNNDKALFSPTYFTYLPISAVYVNSRTNPMGIDVFSVNQLEIMIPQRIRQVSCTDPDKRVFLKNLKIFQNETLSKRGSGTDLFLWSLQNLKSTYFVGHLQKAASNDMIGRNFSTVSILLNSCKYSKSIYLAQKLYLAQKISAMNKNKSFNFQSLEFESIRIL